MTGENEAKNFYPGLGQMLSEDLLMVQHGDNLNIYINFLMKIAKLRPTSREILENVHLWLRIFLANGRLQLGKNSQIHTRFSRSYVSLTHNQFPPGQVHHRQSS